MKPMCPPRAVIFDLDGTLIDSLTLVLAAIQHAIEPFGGRAGREIFPHLGGPPARFIEDLLPDRGDAPAALHRLHAYHREHGHQIRPYEGAREILARLKQEGVPVAIWTGRDRASCTALLRRHGMDGLLMAMVCGDDLSSHKPDPAGLRDILRRLGITPGEALFVGDADVDALGGSACGVATVLIRHERMIGAEVADRVWRIVERPADAFAAVQGCLGLPRIDG